MSHAIILIVYGSFIGVVSGAQEETEKQICERIFHQWGISEGRNCGFIIRGDGEFVRAFAALRPITDSRQDWDIHCLPTPNGLNR